IEAEPVAPDDHAPEVAPGGDLGLVTLRPPDQAEPAGGVLQHAHDRPSAPGLRRRGVGDLRRDGLPHDPLSPGHGFLWPGSVADLRDAGMTPTPPPPVPGCRPRGSPPAVPRAVSRPAAATPPSPGRS